MHKEPSWRAKAMYIVFAFALVFGLAGVVATPQPVSAAAPSITSLTATPDKGFSDLSVDFDVTANHVANVTYAWDFGDGGTSILEDPNHVFTVSGVYAVTVDVTDDDGTTQGTINVGVDPKLMPQGVVYDVKGHTQKFVIVNLPWTQSETEFNANVTTHGMDAALGMAQVNIACDAAVEGCACPNCQIVEWDLTLVNIPGDAFDVIDGGGPLYAIGETEVTSSWCQNWIEVRALEPGDAHIDVWLDEDLQNDTSVANGGDPDDYACNDKDLKLHVEKKWGEIVRTELDMDPLRLGIQSDIYEDAGSGTHGSGTAVQNTINETVYARFLLPDETWSSPLPAAHAEVHWWLFNPDALVTIGLVTKTVAEWIQDEMAKLGPDGCGYWVGLPYPGLAIDNLLSLAAAPKYTVFKEPGTSTPNGLKVETMSDYSGQTAVELDNIGAEAGNTSVMVVLLVDYPYDGDFAGEQPVCIEIGKKHYGVPPPEVQVKTHEVRWAGEKIVLEKQWGSPGQIMTFQLEHPGLGTLEPGGPYGTTIGEVVYAVIECDGVGRAILDSEDPGQADVKLVLLDEWYGEQDRGNGEVVGECAKVVWYLKFEEVSIEILEQTLSEALVQVQVKGYFLEDSNLSSRTELCKDFDLDFDSDGDGDKTNDLICLPAGRWVLPDDWALLAGADWETQRPWWDIMDEPGDLVTALTCLGPYDGDVNTVAETIPPYSAEYPVIGPFSELQPIALDEVTGLPIWVATNSVVADNNDPIDMDYCTAGNQDLALRTTVVPNFALNWYDSPQSTAEVTFNIQSGDAALAEALRWFMDSAPYDWNYYAVELPHSDRLPPLGYPSGYDWDSWIFGVGGGINNPRTGNIDTLSRAPYWFYTDLDLPPYDTTGAIDDQAIEVYSDNHGFAQVRVLNENGAVTITATADYPYLGKHPAMKSDQITITWGAPECNPDFEGVPRECAEVEGCVVTFENKTAGCARPLKEARWDFDGDGTPEITKTAPNVWDPVTWDYGQTGWGEGIYDVCLTIKDAYDALIPQCHRPYITVGEGGVTTHEWPFVEEGFFGRVLPSTYSGDVVLDTLTNIPPEVTGVWYDDYGFQTDWPYWLEFSGSDGLTSLTGGRMYMVMVTGPCTWEIELTP